MKENIGELIKALTNASYGGFQEDPEIYKRLCKRAACVLQSVKNQDDGVPIDSCAVDGAQQHPDYKYIGELAKACGILPQVKEDTLSYVVKVCKRAVVTIRSLQAQLSRFQRRNDQEFKTARGIESQSACHVDLSLNSRLELVPENEDLMIAVCRLNHGSATIMKQSTLNTILHRALRNDEIIRELARAQGYSPELVSALDAMGYQQKEIAAMLGIPAKVLRDLKKADKASA